ncbi:conserved hypothetical protein [Gammaproteobacteria bacterium]
MSFDLKTHRGRTIAWLHAMLIEHNVTNIVRFNFHRISEEAFRSSQPTMWQLRRVVKKYGIKTILNLKGTNTNSAYLAFEREQCAKLGIRLVDIDIYSRSMLDAARIRHATEIFGSVEYPIWMHCKAGADRTGIYATLYQHFRKNIPIDQTNQLKLWPFGHNKYSSAGKFDHYLEHFLAYHKHHPEVGLLEWAENVSDRDAIERQFKENRLASFFNDYLLRRE